MENKKRFYTTEQLSEHMAETPEGFLICYDVPIARIGEQTYKKDEVPVEPNAQGLITIKRTEDEVFKPEALLSFEGKPFTIDHPEEMVTPENWAEKAHGFVTNIRKGLEDKLGTIIGDIVVTTNKAIELIMGGMREISCGYDADYEQLETGIGIQKNIIGNHIALVMRGRAGKRCAIGDNNNITNKIEEEDEAMKFKDKLKAVYRKLIKDADFEKLDDEEKANMLAEAAGSSIEDEIGEEELLANTKTPAEEKKEEVVETDEENSSGEVTNAELKDILIRMLDIMELVAKSSTVGDKKVKDDEEVIEEKKDEEEIKTEDVNEGGSAKSMAQMEDEDIDEEEELKKAEAKDCDSTWHDTAYRADLLAPGIKISKPTKDHAAAILKIKKRAVSKAYTTDADIVNLYVKDVASLDGKALDVAFIAISEAMKSKNNKFVTDSLIQNTKGVSNDIRSIQKRNEEYWKKNK